MMSPELDAELCKKYPLLYADRHADMQHTCMCWGFCVGDGWYDIINRLSMKLEALIQALPEEQRGLCKAAQVKEKFGILRFYMDGETPEMTAAIQLAENDAAKTCEACGAPGYTYGKSWLKTLCDNCHNKRGER